jgi:Flp pilus assembly protein TadB
MSARQGEYSSLRRTRSQAARRRRNALVDLGTAVLIVLIALVAGVGYGPIAIVAALFLIVLGVRRFRRARAAVRSRAGRSDETPLMRRRQGL